MTLCTCIMMFPLSAHSSSVVGYIMGYIVHLEIIMTAIVQVIGLIIDTL